MNRFEQLETKINNKEAKICILGLGYVGLPLALLFANKEYTVIGYDPNQGRIDNLTSGEKYITDIEPEEATEQIEKGFFKPTANEEDLADADIYIICVPTPIRHVKTPDMSYIISASQTIKKYVSDGNLIILESTTYPGTSREVILPEIESKGLKLDDDFFLAFSPERVDPGNKQFPVHKIPKVVGGITEKSTKLSVDLYGKIMETIVPVSSIETAETVKLLENTFRLVNIGLINEFAILCDKLGIDVWEVIEGAKTKPFGFMPFYPGPGLGGHCIPCDPIYLSWKAQQIGFNTRMIDLAADTNRYMPEYVVLKTQDLIDKCLSKSKILILGITYKKDVKDLRESPALDIIETLQSKGASVDFYDPLVPYLALQELNMDSIDIENADLSDYDCVILTTDHSDGVDYDRIQGDAKLIYDTRRVYKKKYDNVISL